MVVKYFCICAAEAEKQATKNVLNDEGTAAFNCFAAICIMCVLRTEGWTRKKQSYSEALVFSR